jgi:glutamine synthetase
MQERAILADGMAEKLESIVETCQTGNIDLIRFLYCDTSSIIRGKSTYVRGLYDRLVSGIGLVKGMMAMNMLDQLQPETGLGATGEVRLVPDLSTFTILPYVSGQAALLCDLQELNQRPWDLCPRSILKQQLSRSAAMGFTIQAAFEPEFMLLQNNGGMLSPIDESLCFSTEGMNRGADFISGFVDALEQQKLEVEQYYPELGHGQHELSIKHAPALLACDRHLFYRETLRGCAQNSDLVATLAPKPFLDQPGNGCHLHVSCWDMSSGQNLMYAQDDPNDFSDFGRHFVAGILEHLPAITAITCPSVNSYRRLQPSAWSSAFTCWGFENREAAIRVPSLYWGHEQASSNIEIKCVDSSTNPYLALACVIAAGISGLEAGVYPPKPIDLEPSILSSEQRQQNKIRRLPQTLIDALVELEKDSVLMACLGEKFLRTFCIVKSSEVTSFAIKDPEYELLHHRTKF